MVDANRSVSMDEYCGSRLAKRETGGSSVSASYLAVTDRFCCMVSQCSRDGQRWANVQDTTVA